MKTENQSTFSIPEKVPIIVAAMTQGELPCSESEEAKNGYPEKRVSDFLELLEANDMGGVCTCYGEKRQDWKPFGGEQTIGELLDDLFTRQRDRFPFGPEFSFIDGFFAQDPIESSSAWSRLKLAGRCFLIVDGISLHHSKISSSITQAFQQVSADQFSMVVLSPFSMAHHPAHAQLVALLEQEYRGFLGRYQTDLDPTVEILAADAICFYRWLRMTMERTKSELKAELGPMNAEKRLMVQRLSEMRQPRQDGDSEGIYP